MFTEEVEFAVKTFPQRNLIASKNISASQMASLLKSTNIWWRNINSLKKIGEEETLSQFVFSEHKYYIKMDKIFTRK